MSYMNWNHFLIGIVSFFNITAFINGDAIGKSSASRVKTHWFFSFHSQINGDVRLRHVAVFLGDEMKILYWSWSLHFTAYTLLTVFTASTSPTSSLSFASSTIDYKFYRFHHFSYSNTSIKRSRTRPTLPCGTAPLSAVRTRLQDWACSKADIIFLRETRVWFYVNNKIDPNS